MFTRVWCSDRADRAVPYPVHVACIRPGEGWQRVPPGAFGGKFIVKGKLVESLPEGTPCRICGKPI